MFFLMILIYTESKFGRWQHFFRTLFDRKLESNLFYKLNITLMGLCLPSLDINVVFTRQLCGKSIYLKSLMYIFQWIGVYVTFHIPQALVFITWAHRGKKYVSYIPDTHFSVHVVVVHWMDIIYYDIKSKYRILLGCIFQRT